jgi:hypothetical protein
LHASHEFTRLHLAKAEMRVLWLIQCVDLDRHARP